MYCDYWTYRDGRIYYSPLESGEIHKIRTDGTGETFIYTGGNVLYINYAGSNSQPGNALERETILHARYYIGNVID